MGFEILLFSVTIYPPFSSMDGIDSEHVSGPESSHNSEHIVEIKSTSSETLISGDAISQNHKSVSLSVNYLSSKKRRTSVKLKLRWRLVDVLADAHPALARVAYRIRHP
jgi:hypothetical protein